MLFDASVDAKLVSKSADRDVLTSSAVNFYSGLTQREVEAFYASLAAPGDTTPVSLGELAAREARRRAGRRGAEGGGRYTQAIERMVGSLEKAAAKAENDAQRAALTKLIAFYRSGSLKDWDDYNIAWLRDTESHVDLIHGFIEVYHDPLGMRSTFESVVSFRDPEATRRIGAIAGGEWTRITCRSSSATRSRTSPESRARSSTSSSKRRRRADNADRHEPAELRLDSPRARLQIGEPQNVVAAYNAVRSEVDREFSYDSAEIERNERCGELAAALHVDLHEVIGHGSGQLEPGIGPLHETMKTTARPSRKRVPISWRCISQSIRSSSSSA